MKKIILSALAGALVMFLTIFGIAAVSVSREKAQEPRSYVHVDYVSELLQEDCFLCGNGSGPITSHVQITGVQYSIDRESVQGHLCQSCLNTINNLWFSAGNYGVDCEFKDNGAIDLRIHYCPNRYE